MNGLVVLAVDPGRDKCGIAVVVAGPRVLARAVVAVGAAVLPRILQTLRASAAAS